MISFQPPQADESTFRELLTLVLGALLNLNRGTQIGLNIAQNSYHHLEQLMPLVEKYAPTSSAELRDWSRTVERALDPSTRIYQEINRLTQNGSVDEILAVAEKYPPEYQDSIYQNAARKAFSGGDVERAKEIAGKIADPFQRRHFLDQIESQGANNLKAGARLAYARAQVEKARSLPRKVALIAQFSDLLASNNQMDDALALLNDGKVLVTAAPPSAEQVKAQLQLAQAYAKVNAGETFAILQPLIMRLNELLAAAAVLDGLDFRYFKEGEWEMPGMNSLGMIVNALDHTLTELGRTDFDRALALAEANRPAGNSHYDQNRPRSSRAWRQFQQLYVPPTQLQSLRNPLKPGERRDLLSRPQLRVTIKKRFSRMSLLSPNQILLLSYCSIPSAKYFRSAPQSIHKRSGLRAETMRDNERSDGARYIASTFFAVWLRANTNKHSKCPHAALRRESYRRRGTSRGDELLRYQRLPG